MLNVLQTALLFGTAVVGSGGLGGALAIFVKTKADSKAAQANIEQADRKLHDEGERADRKQESENEAARYVRLERECDRFERMYLKTLADYDALRMTWGNLDTTFDEVFEREAARHKRLTAEKNKEKRQ